MPPQDEMAVPAAAAAADELEKSGATKPDNVDRSDFLSFIRTKGAPPPRPKAPKPPEGWDEKTSDKSGLYRAMRQSRKGGLHRALHLPEDQKIPDDRLEKAKTSKNPHVRKMASVHQ